MTSPCSPLTSPCSPGAAPRRPASAADPGCAIPPPMTDWTARRILRELVDGARRKDILADFWRFADAGQRGAAEAYLAKALRFREVTVRKMPPAKKAELLALRLADPEAEAYLEMALLQHHLHHGQDLMAAFLDRWGIPHEKGAIADGDGRAPDLDAVRESVATLADRFDRVDVRLYLAAAGLVMGEDWRRSTWAVVDEMA
jgi:hypothetical protein